MTHGQPADLLHLVPLSPEHLRALMAGPQVYSQKFNVEVADGLREMFGGTEASPEFLARIECSTGPEPWQLGFVLVHAAENRVVGMCGYKGPPNETGRVEVAYAIAPDYRGRGYAKQAARLLLQFAFQSGKVKTVIAHTLPEINASGRVLQACGFRKIGEVHDPQDGVVWQWEFVPP